MVHRTVAEGRRVLAFHTDADLRAATEAYTAVTLLARTGQLQVLTAMLADTTFPADTASGFCAARSLLRRSAMSGWQLVMRR